MSKENLEICYKGIQRIYRNAVVRFLRLEMCKAFPADYEIKLRAPFQKEWETLKTNTSSARITGELATQISDDFDLLSVNHFFNLFDSYYENLIKTDPNISPDEKKRQKQPFLNWLKTIKTLRDPLSHPCEEDFTREDAFQLLDCARRVLSRIGLQDEEDKIKTLIDALLEKNHGLSNFY